ncbi:hypothetical protein WICPIJ_003642, partial [Wickerhamomyces pijperi]
CAVDAADEGGGVGLCGGVSSLFFSSCVSLISKVDSSFSICWSSKTPDAGLKTKMEFKVLVGLMSPLSVRPALILVESVVMVKVSSFGSLVRRKGFERSIPYVCWVWGSSNDMLKTSLFLDLLLLLLLGVGDLANNND